ncbi:MAG: 4-(cytidine 5'-diphospho)-2-C-methyl-D-erythritol kinase [Candidatus Peregrinibacteria bacterium]
MKVHAPAKINLALDVLKKSPQGYHEIQTILHEIPDLHDTIEIYESKQDELLSIPQATQNTQQNLAFKALELIKSTTQTKKHTKIIIHKKIPISSGLGGASSDAAATLKALNLLWNLKLSQNDLLSLAEQLGSDVPFFVHGKTALATHFGEKITPLPHITNIKFQIHLQKTHTPQPNKTKNAYARLDLSKCAKNTDKTEALIQAIKSNNTPQILSLIHNDFETLTPTKPPHHLSGSGPATFTAEPL